LENPEQVEAHRSKMSTFYSILKDSDNYIRLLMITGVSQFSKTSIFSDLNNLRNITLVTPFGDIVGISQTELEENFAQEISQLQKTKPDILNQIKTWYNGYTWNMQTWVYNPFSLLNFMADPVFRNYWFETATPTFLYKLLKDNAVYDVEKYEIGGQELSNFNTNDPDMAPLLFQTGYLTIKKFSEQDSLYELGFPNREVRASLLGGLLSAYRLNDGQSSMDLLVGLRTTLINGDIPAMILRLNAIIASLPYDHWSPKTETAFHALIHIGFKFAGLDVESEVHSAKGRCDILVKTDLYIYAMDLKLDDASTKALAQIKEKGYLKPYASDPRKKFAVGISCCSKKREIGNYMVEEQ